MDAAVPPMSGGAPGLGSSASSPPFLDGVEPAGSMTDWTPDVQNGFCYAIASGEYSDYSIHCVFEKLPDALAYLRQLRGKDSDAVFRGGWRHGVWEYERSSYQARVEPFQFWRTPITTNKTAR